ncbi:MAG: hypothetical protein QOF36_1054 [Microbacteriaceae bacterium]|nr:hypothetical protein [Microbacteriaceae bacterium]
MALRGSPSDGRRELIMALAGSRDGLAADSQGLAIDENDIALGQLPAAAGLGLTVYRNPSVGEQQLDVRALFHSIGELQKLAEADLFVADHDVSHRPIIADRTRRGGSG